MQKSNDLTSNRLLNVFNLNKKITDIKNILTLKTNISSGNCWKMTHFLLKWSLFRGRHSFISGQYGPPHGRASPRPQKLDEGPWWHLRFCRYIYPKHPWKNSIFTYMNRGLITRWWLVHQPI